MSEVIAGRYELEELVGKGGMSSVYRAHDRLLERKVALKILHDQFTRDQDYVERFRREARAAAQLGHPNIVTVIDRGEHEGRQFIVFEYVDGETLKQLVERRGPLPVREALELTLQVADALAFAHERGVVHRDVKPQNVLLNGDGRPKVTDFGIARSIDVDGLTQTGAVVGTSDYIAPEQARGEHVDVQSDVYSLGVVLYELLTGEVPFSADNFVAVAMRHVTDPPPSILERRPDVPLRLVAAVDRALEKDPDDRFASMQELVEELEACLDDLGPEIDSDMTLVAGGLARPKPARRPRERRRRRIGAGPLILLGGVLVTAAAVIGFVALRGGDGSANGTRTDGGPRARPQPVVLSGVGSFDPFGDGEEHSSDAASATDGDPATYWTTEVYYDQRLNKPGVGLVLDARREAEPRRVTVSTDTTGFTAQIRAGDSPSGDFRPVSSAKIVGPSTVFELRDDVSARYFLVWITEIAGDRAHVNEVTVTT